MSQHHSVVLRRDGIGSPSRLDSRGGLGLPLWLRRLAGDPGVVHVAARRPDGLVVVISPASALDPAIEGLAGEAG